MRALSNCCALATASPNRSESVLALHRVRLGFVKARTGRVNPIRGLLAEFGLVVSQGIAHIVQRVPNFIEDASVELPGSFRLLIDRLLKHLQHLHSPPRVRRRDFSHRRVPFALFAPIS